MGDLKTGKTPDPVKARNVVFAYINERLAGTDPSFSEDDVNVVWFAYVLGNWKALVMSTRAVHMYYEVTFRDATQEVYIDVYKKVSNGVFAVQATPL